MQWFTPRNDLAYPAKYVSKSADGYYGIELDSDEVRFRAYYIAALWAQPEFIGAGVTIAEAQAACERHRGLP